MEALAAFALACNVLQVISFSREAISLANDVRRDGSINVCLAESAQRTEKLTDELKTSAKSPTDAHRELLLIASDCNKAAKDIKTELDQISSSSGTFRKTIKALRRKSKLDQLDKNLSRYQNVLHSRLLYQIYKTQDAVQAQQLDEFRALDDSFQDLIRQYSSGQIQIQQLIERTSTETVVRISASLGNIQDLISSEHEKTRLYVSNLQKSSETTQISEARRQRLLQSLYFETMNQQRTQIDHAYIGTFEWIFNAEEPDPRSSFKTWIQSDKPLFWISGKPGSGKSTLMKYLVHNATLVKQLSLELSHCDIYSHFIWNSGSTAERSLRGLYCSLLYQVLSKRPEIADRILQTHLHIREHSTVFDWETTELRELLSSALQLHLEPVCLFIDGLDEIDVQEDPLNLVETIKTLIDENRKLKICISSRPEPIWNTSLSNLPSVRLQDLTKEDMCSTAEGLLNEYFPRYLIHMSKVETDRIVGELLRKADGVFLWLRLALKSLQRGISGQESEDDLLDRLHVLPQGIQSLYRDMWKRLGEDEPLYRQQAAQYFKLVLRWNFIERKFFTDRVVPERFLTSTAILFASHASIQENILKNGGRSIEASVLVDALKKTEHKLETRCAGLLELIPLPAVEEVHDLTRHKVFAKGEIVDFQVRFLHRSARDYLLETVEGLELLKSCKSVDEDLDFSIVKAKLCYALIFSEPWPRGFSHEQQDSMTWSFENDENSLHSLGAMKRFNNEYPLLEEKIIEMVLVLKRELEIRSLTTFPELVARYGFAKWLPRVLDVEKLEAVDQCAIESYLFDQGPYWRYRPEIEDRLDQWMVHRQLDFEWSSIHTAVFPGQSIPLMTSVLEDILFTLLWYPQRSLRLCSNKSTPRFLRKDIINSRKKVVVHLRLLHFTEGYYSIDASERDGWKIYAGEPSPQDMDSYADWFGPRTDFILETNVAQLVNTALSAVLEKLSSSEEDTHSISMQMAQLEPLLYESEKCHNRILLVGNFDKQFVPSGENSWDDWVESGKFCEPTEIESCLLLKHILVPGVLHFDHITENAGREIEELVETIVSGSDSKVTDIAKTLRRRGYYIPTQEEIDAYIHAKSFKDRFLAMKSMNEKNAKSVVFDHTV